MIELLADAATEHDPLKALILAAAYAEISNDQGAEQCRAFARIALRACGLVGPSTAESDLIGGTD